MRTLFYIPESCNDAGLIEQITASLDGQEGREVACTLEGLCQALRRPGERPHLAVLVAASTEDLMGLVSLRDLLQDIPVLLVGPDREEQDLALAHLLRPRFLTFVDSNLAELAAVRAKMIENHHKRSARDLLRGVNPAAR